MVLHFKRKIIPKYTQTHTLKHSKFIKNHRSVKLINRERKKKLWPLLKIKSGRRKYFQTRQLMKHVIHFIIANNMAFQSIFQLTKSPKWTFVVSIRFTFCANDFAIFFGFCFRLAFCWKNFPLNWQYNYRHADCV